MEARSARFVLFFPLDFSPFTQHNHSRFIHDVTGINTSFLLTAERILSPQIPATPVSLKSGLPPQLRVPRVPCLGSPPEAAGPRGPSGGSRDRPETALCPLAQRSRLCTPVAHSLSTLTSHSTSCCPAVWGKFTSNRLRCRPPGSVIPSRPEAGARAPGLSGGAHWLACVCVCVRHVSSTHRWLPQPCTVPS